MFSFIYFNTKRNLTKFSSKMAKESNDARKQFGNRYLNDGENVFKHNAWDDVQWDDEQEANALAKVEKNSTVTMSKEEVENFESKADTFWDAFYDIHQNKFFKDRHWLFAEFPELKSQQRFQGTDSNGDTALFNIFEIGCGVGNTILPILKYNTDPNLRLFGCDFSPRAIDILRTHQEFDDKRSNVFVLDATADVWQNVVPFEENSLDIIVMIFVMSAINPDRMQGVMEKCFKYLKAGGLVLFRDYGLYDLAQLRIKSGKCLQKNFYVRGDGTRVYFFQQDELRSLFERCGFVEEFNLVDRRLQVNRCKQLKMYRVWIQAKYRKPMAEITATIS